MVASGRGLVAGGAVMMKHMEGVKPLQFQAWVGFCLVLAAGGVLSAVLEPKKVQAGASPPAGRSWPAALYSGLVVSVGAHTGYRFLIGRYEANLISPLTLMTPLATIALGVAIFADPFGARMMAGTAHRARPES